MDRFELVADYRPAGDQPEAITALVEGLRDGLARQTLLGVTGSGKTFTIANVIQAVQRPTLVLAPNKPWPLSYTVKCANSFRTTASNISFPTTITTSLRPTCRRLTPI